MKTLEHNAWVTTDLHFNHKKLSDKGFRPEGYEHQIQTNWASTVRSSDVIYCLGDVCMGKEGEAHETIIKILPGYKILIRGNHDKQKDSWYLTHGWNEIHDSLKLVTTVNGRHTRLLLSHGPIPDDGSFDLNLHGHFHDDTHRAESDEMKAILCAKHRLLSLELVNYSMVALNSFLEAGTNHLHHLKSRPPLY